jgi:hypothetical protein
MIWYCIPSAKPAREAQDCIDAWRGMGYKVAVWRDTDAQPVNCDFATYGPYPGYAQAVNVLAQTALAMDPACQWVVTGGDDVFPDTSKHSDEIAQECSNYFGGAPRIATVELKDAGERYGVYPAKAYETYGIMQPIGDGWGGIERICGSPWMGREWCLRANKGAGPLHPDYFHMHVDEHLQEAAKAQGVLWQRKDIKHEHRHWARENKPMPAYLAQVNTQRHWDESKALFNRHRASRFAESYPI